MSDECRDINDEPFCWQSKAALRKIREAFDSEKAVNSAIGVYVALTEIASDMQTPVFQTTHAYIGQKSGLSSRTVESRLPGLVEIGLVKITTPSLRAPSTYQLLREGDPKLSRNEPKLSRCVPKRAKKAPFRLLEESYEESYEEITIPPLLDTPEFREAWANWLRYRCERRKEVTPTGARISLSKCEKLGVEKSIAAINHSIENGWQGIFEPNDGRPATHGPFRNGKLQIKPDHSKGF